MRRIWITTAAALFLASSAAAGPISLGGLPIAGHPVPCKVPEPVTLAFVVLALLGILRLRP